MFDMVLQSLAGEGPGVIEPSSVKYTTAGSTKTGQGELSRLLNAAVICSAFCELLLDSPTVALAQGYDGEPFHLQSEDEKLILSTRATSLADFAQQLTLRRNGKRNGR